MPIPPEISLKKQAIQNPIFLGFPKPSKVAEAISDYILNIGSNSGRGIYESSFQVEHILYETRELIAKMFNFSDPSHVVFTKNITESLNILLKGLLNPGDHVIVSSMEHNAVMRPLNALSNRGVTFSSVYCSEDGALEPDQILGHINKNTKIVLMTHASNVCGTILDLEAVGKICKDNNLIFLVDAAQTAGFLDIDFEKIQADALAFTGHKGLLGPQGIGGFIITELLAKKMGTFIEGGTGSFSDQEIQPNYMPDKFESGTLNIPGIYGLNASLKYIEKTSLEKIRAKELMLVRAFIEGLEGMKAVQVIGKKDLENRTGVVSVDFLGLDNANISYHLYSDYGIATRCGMHCAPSAHKTLGTFPQGTVRFSFSHFNTLDEVMTTLNAITKILSNA